MKVLVHPTCPYCHQAVKPGQAFDMWREIWTEEFPRGCNRRSMTVVAHSVCNPAANHTRD